MYYANNIIAWALIALLSTLLYTVYDIRTIQDNVLPVQVEAQVVFLDTIFPEVSTECKVQASKVMLGLYTDSSECSINVVRYMSLYHG